MPPDTTTLLARGELSGLTPSAVRAMLREGAEDHNDDGWGVSLASRRLQLGGRTGIVTVCKNEATWHIRPGMLQHGEFWASWK